MRLKPVVLITINVLFLAACQKDSETIPDNPNNPAGGKLPQRIVEVAPNNDSAVAEFVFTNNGQIAGGTLKAYVRGSIEVSSTTTCSFYPNGLLQSAVTNNFVTGTGLKERNDITCYLDPGGNLITGVRYKDSSDNYTAYQKLVYDNNKRLVIVYPDIDSASFFTPQAVYMYKDSLVYENGNLSKFISLNYDPLSGTYQEFSREVLSNFDNKVRYLPNGTNTFILLDYEPLISANNEGSISFSDYFGNAGTISTSISYDDKDRPVKISYTDNGAGDAFGFGIFTAVVKERRIYYQE